MKPIQAERCGDGQVLVADITDADPLPTRARATAGGERPRAIPGLVMTDGTMRTLHRMVERIAGGAISILILGETGVGKEVLAETIHRLSPRSHGPLLRLNCAALSESLLESELFGHERGAFTGAVQTKAGLLETAQGGTVFLDEVGELPMTMQVKLLRVIEARQVVRVGALKPRPIDVRFVAATNRDLEYDVERGVFRQDLFFRLNGVSLMIPPLRERVEEIEGLARGFVAQACALSGLASPPVRPDALALLKGYRWPGNIRELRNVMERALLLSGGDPISPEHLPEKICATSGTRPPPDEIPACALAESPAPEVSPAQTPPPAATGEEFPSSLIEIRREMRTLERERILAILARCGGNQTEAAQILGVSRRTLMNRLDRWGVPRPRKRQGSDGS